MQVVLNKKEKEELVIKLYQDGKPIREIARQAHLSFGSIGKIIKTINNNGDDNWQQHPSQQKRYGCSKMERSRSKWRSN